MTTPCIHIKQLESNIYEWAVVIDSVEVTSDIGESSISGCLESALSTMPSEILFIEVKYRGIHFGTFTAVEVAHGPELVAAKVISEYAKLMQAYH